MRDSEPIPPGLRKLADPVKHRKNHERINLKEEPHENLSSLRSTRRRSRPYAQSSSELGSGSPGNDTSDGSGNTGGGSGALANNQGTFNTAYGNTALLNNAQGILNTAIGQGTLTANTAGVENTAVGAGALTNNVGVQNCSTCGNNNTALGFQAMFTNGTRGVGGSFNTGVGNNALFGTDSDGLSGGGNNNTAIGNNALLGNIFGSSSTAVGDSALLNAGGGNNIAIGASAGFNLTSGSNNIYLGNLGASTESKTMRLGQVQTRTFVAGVYSAHASARQVFINSNGQLGTLASSARYKRDIQTMGDRSRALLKLRPVTFHYKLDPHGELQYGLIAEEVAKVYPDLVTKAEDGKIESVQYHELIPMLLNEIQHQQEQLDQLKVEKARLQATLVDQNAALAARLERLETAAHPGEAGFGLRLSSLVNKISARQP
jgi:hypothetical protein